jgi:hypothetical protein
MATMPRNRITLPALVAGALLVLSLLAPGALAQTVEAGVTVTVEADILTPSEPLHVPWTALLPPAPAEYEPDAGGLCPAGQNKCVDTVIREMTRRFNPLASSCDHDAVFALVYLRTTQEYRRAVSDPEFFTDNAFVNHEDVVFADHYFQAYDAWHRGSSGVPAAWQVAFQAADRGGVSGTGNLLLGMNAHVNRDLPFVLEQIGIVAPDGSSRKPDHDRVNEILARVNLPVIEESARRLDPTMDDGRIDGTSLDDTAVLQLLVEWREEAWRNAERLVTAHTEVERALVAQQIEDVAALKAQVLAETYAYRPPLSDSEARDQWCAQHWDDQ